MQFIIVIKLLGHVAISSYVIPMAHTISYTVKYVNVDTKITVSKGLRRTCSQG